MQKYLFIFTAADAYCRKALQESNTGNCSIVILKNLKNTVKTNNALEFLFEGHLERNDPSLTNLLEKNTFDKIIVVCGKQYSHDNVSETILRHQAYDPAQTGVELHISGHGFVPLSRFKPSIAAVRPVDDLVEQINSMWWYHNIPLTNDITTPGLEFYDIWNQIRQTRLSVDYTNKLVLDIATFNGLFAFEAEKLGAKSVIATDTWHSFFNNFMLIKESIGSKAMPFFNVSPYNLVNGLDVLNDDEEHHEFSGFDIIQNFGLMYHLRDPMLVFSQCRSMISNNGVMIVETAAINDTTNSFLAFNHNPGRQPDEHKYNFYPDVTTWWVPTIKCLFDMLRTSFFEPIESTLNYFEQPGCGNNAGRVCLVAKTKPLTEINDQVRSELSRTFRNPGMSRKVFL